MWIIVFTNGKRLSELIVVNLQDVMRMLWEGGERLSIRTKGDGVIEVNLKSDVVELVKNEYELRVIVEKFMREGKIG